MASNPYLDEGTYIAFTTSPAHNKNTTSSDSPHSSVDTQNSVTSWTLGKDDNTVVEESPFDAASSNSAARLSFDPYAPYSSATEAPAQSVGSYTEQAISRKPLVFDPYSLYDPASPASSSSGNRATPAASATNAVTFVSPYSGDNGFVIKCDDVEQSLENSGSSGNSDSADWTGSRRWNEEFQNLLLLPGDTSEEKLAKYIAIRNLTLEFTKECKEIAKKIILAYPLPEPEKKAFLRSHEIFPLEKRGGCGGIAGGTKFLSRGIFFKFAVDVVSNDTNAPPTITSTPVISMTGASSAATSPTSTAHHPRGSLYGGTENAMKAAAHELKGLKAYMDCEIREFHFPLMVTIDYGGYRLVATSQLPIRNTTIVYGSYDGARTVHKNKDNAHNFVAKLMEAAAKQLNLKGHLVGDKLLYAPGDIEVHIGADGRCYIVDTARVFPPALPTGREDRRGEHLFHLLRRELVATNPVPLSSDAFSGFGATDHEREQHNAEVRDATIRLVMHVIVDFAQRLNARELVPIDGVGLITLMHRAGINARFLGVLRTHVTLKHVKELIFTEMIARVATDALRERMRESRATSEDGLKRVVLEYFNKVIFGFDHDDSQQAEYFWTTEVKRRLAVKFDYSIPDPPLRWSALTDAEAAPHYDLREKSILLFALFQRLQERTGVVFSLAAQQQLFDRSGRPERPMQYDDIVYIGTKEKSIEVDDEICRQLGQVISRRLRSATATAGPAPMHAAVAATGSVVSTPTPYGVLRSSSESKWRAFLPLDGDVDGDGSAAEAGKNALRAKLQFLQKYVEELKDIFGMRHERVRAAMRDIIDIQKSLGLLEIAEDNAIKLLNYYNSANTSGTDEPYGTFSGTSAKLAHPSGAPPTTAVFTEFMHTLSDLALLGEIYELKGEIKRAVEQYNSVLMFIARFYIDGIHPLAGKMRYAIGRLLLDRVNASSAATIVATPQRISSAAAESTPTSSAAASLKQEALKFLQQSLSIYQSVYGDQCFEVANLLLILADATRGDDSDYARVCLDQALEAAQRITAESEAAGVADMTVEGIKLQAEVHLHLSEYYIVTGGPESLDDAAAGEHDVDPAVSRLVREFAIELERENRDREAKQKALAHSREAFRLLASVCALPRSANQNTDSPRNNSGLVKSTRQLSKSDSAAQADTSTSTSELPRPPSLKRLSRTCRLLGNLYRICGDYISATLYLTMALSFGELSLSTAGGDVMPGNYRRPQLSAASAAASWTSRSLSTAPVTLPLVVQLFSELFMVFACVMQLTPSNLSYVETKMVTAVTAAECGKYGRAVRKLSRAVKRLHSRAAVLWGDRRKRTMRQLHAATLVYETVMAVAYRVLTTVASKEGSAALQQVREFAEMAQGFKMQTKARIAHEVHMWLEQTEKPTANSANRNSDALAPVNAEAEYFEQLASVCERLFPEYSWENYIVAIQLRARRLADADAANCDRVVTLLPKVETAIDVSAAIHSSVLASLLISPALPSRPAHQSVYLATIADGAAVSLALQNAYRNLSEFGRTLGLSGLEFDQHNTCVIVIERMPTSTTGSEQFKSVPPLTASPTYHQQRLRRSGGSNKNAVMKWSSMATTTPGAVLITLNLTFEPHSRRLFIYASLLDDNPPPNTALMFPPKDPSKRLAVFQRLLEGALMGRQIAGGGIGIKSKEGLCLLHYGLDMEKAGPDRLRQFAPVFVDTVVKWRQIVHDMLSPPPTERPAAQWQQQTAWEIQLQLQSMAPSMSTMSTPYSPPSELRAAESASMNESLLYPQKTQQEELLLRQVERMSLTDNTGGVLSTDVPVEAVSTSPTAQPHSTMTHVRRPSSGPTNSIQVVPSVPPPDVATASTETASGRRKSKQERKDQKEREKKEKRDRKEKQKKEKSAKSNPWMLLWGIGRLFSRSSNTATTAATNAAPSPSSGPASSPNLEKVSSSSSVSSSDSSTASPLMPRVATPTSPRYTPTAVFPPPAPPISRSGSTSSYALPLPPANDTIDNVPSSTATSTPQGLRGKRKRHYASSLSDSGQLDEQTLLAIIQSVETHRRQQLLSTAVGSGRTSAPAAPASSAESTPPASPTQSLDPVAVDDTAAAASRDWSLYPKGDEEAEAQLQEALRRSQLTACGSESGMESVDNPKVAVDLDMDIETPAATHKNQKSDAKTAKTSVAGAGSAPATRRPSIGSAIFSGVWGSLFSRPLNSLHRRYQRHAMRRHDRAPKSVNHLDAANDVAKEAVENAECIVQPIAQQHPPQDSLRKEDDQSEATTEECNMARPHDQLAALEAADSSTETPVVSASAESEEMTLLLHTVAPSAEGNVPRGPLDLSKLIMGTTLSAKSTHQMAASASSFTTSSAASNVVENHGGVDSPVRHLDAAEAAALEAALANLRHLAKETNQELEFDEHYTCVVAMATSTSSHESTVDMHVTFEPRTKRLYVYSPLVDAELLQRCHGNQAALLELYERLLEGAFIGGSAAGGGIGISVADGICILHCAIDVDTANHNALRQIAPLFVDTVAKWRWAVAAIVEKALPEEERRQRERLRMEARRQRLVSVAPHGYLGNARGTNAPTASTPGTAVSPGSTEPLEECYWEGVDAALALEHLPFLGIKEDSELGYYGNRLNARSSADDVSLNANPTVVHDGVQCVICGISSIQGTRFMCLNCNADLCAKCEAMQHKALLDSAAGKLSTWRHPPHHLMLVLLRPLPANGEPRPYVPIDQSKELNRSLTDAVPYTFLCRGCWEGSSLKGNAAFRCANCADEWLLCERCFARGCHSNSHVMIKLYSLHDPAVWNAVLGLQLGSVDMSTSLLPLPVMYPDDFVRRQGRVEAEVQQYFAEEANHAALCSDATLDTVFHIWKSATASAPARAGALYFLTRILFAPNHQLRLEELRRRGVTMATLVSTLSTSPTAPPAEPEMHHAFVSALFAEWQRDSGHERMPALLSNSFQVNSGLLKYLLSLCKFSHNFSHVGHKAVRLLACLAACDATVHYVATDDALATLLVAVETGGPATAAAASFILRKLAETHDAAALCKLRSPKVFQGILKARNWHAVVAVAELAEASRPGAPCSAGSGGPIGIHGVESDEETNTYRLSLLLPTGDSQVWKVPRGTPYLEIAVHRAMAAASTSAGLSPKTIDWFLSFLLTGGGSAGRADAAALRQCLAAFARMTESAECCRNIRQDGGIHIFLQLLTMASDELSAAAVGESTNTAAPVAEGIRSSQNRRWGSPQLLHWLIRIFHNLCTNDASTRAVLRSNLRKLRHLFQRHMAPLHAAAALAVVADIAGAYPEPEALMTSEGLPWIRTRLLQSQSPHERLSALRVVSSLAGAAPALHSLLKKEGYVAALWKAALDPDPHPVAMATVAIEALCRLAIHDTRNVSVDTLDGFSEPMPSMATVQFLISICGHTLNISRKTHAIRLVAILAMSPLQPDAESHLAAAAAAIPTWRELIGQQAAAFAAVLERDIGEVTNVAHRCACAFGFVAAADAALAVNGRTGLVPIETVRRVFVDHVLPALWSERHAHQWYALEALTALARCSDNYGDQWDSITRAVQGGTEAVEMRLIEIMSESDSLFLVVSAASCLKYRVVRDPVAKKRISQRLGEEHDMLDSLEELRQTHFHPYVRRAVEGFLTSAFS